MASNVKPRLEALAVYLEQCENEGNFHDLRKQQFDLLLSSLETQLAALDFSDGAAYAAILRSMETQLAALDFSDGAAYAAILRSMVCFVMHLDISLMIFN